MQLFVCCADERGSMAACDACDVTPWLALAQHGALKPSLYLPMLAGAAATEACAQLAEKLAQGVCWRGVWWCCACYVPALAYRS